MLGKKLINPGAVACTTDTTQILDAGTTQSTALYRFEDNANDTASSTGKFNKGGIFNGTSSVVTINSSFDFSSSFSISMWFNADTLPSSTYIPLFFTDGYGGSTSDYGIAFYLYGNTIKPWIDRQNTYTNIFTAGTLSTSTWYHVVLTRTYNSKWELFLDGSSLGTYTSAGLTDNYTPSSFSTIGKHSNSAMWFDGKIDQVRVFNKALSTSEITTLYNETTTTANTLQVLGDTSCVAAYTFEGNANDLSTNHNGTASNVTYDYSGTLSGATYVTGKFGKAASFDGTNDYISASNPNASGGARSFSAWIKTTSTGFQSIITNGGTSHASGLNMFVYNNKLYSTSGNGTSGENYGPTSSVNANTGEWVHCALTMSGTASGSILKTYVNGTLDGTHTTTVTITDTFDAFRIGGRYVNGSYASAWFNGQIDQVRIFSKELSPGEINSLYNETTTTAALGTITNPSTVAYYKMQDATDETGSYNQTASTVNFNVKGKYGFAAEFNGSSSYMSFPAPYSHTSNTDNITVSWWMNGDTAFSNGSFWSILGGEIANSSGNAGTININAYGKGTNQVYIALTRVWGSSARYHASGSTSSSDWVTMIPGQWYHNVITYDPTTNSSKYYVDGTLIYNITFSTYTTSGNNTNSTLAWGKYRNSNSYFNGKIDQARFFNKVISADEVTKLYNEIQCDTAITTPESYFNSVLYTGNATSRSITTTFQPDFVWLKSRGSNRNHRLFDSIRGATKGLYSDVSNAEYTENSLTAFNTNGFTLGTAGNQNNSSESYVSWSWKAGSLINKSAYFNGSSSKIVLPDNILPDNSTGSSSASVWFRSSSGNTAGDSECILNAYAHDTNKPGWSFFMEPPYGGNPDGHLYLANYSLGGTSGGTSAGYRDGKWHHAAIVLDNPNDTIKVYLDGNTTTPVLSQTASVANVWPFTEMASIGYQRLSSGDIRYFNGNINQVRIFNKALSASEITTLYNETASTINTLQILGDTSCVVTYLLGTNANDLDTSTPKNATANANVVFNKPGHLTRNNNGTIESTVSALPESGFSIVKYIGNATSGATFGHGLNSKPELILIKNLDHGSNYHWTVYSGPNGATGLLYLNLTDAFTSTSSRFNNTEPTSSVVTLGNDGTVNDSGDDHIAYCFANVDGYQRIGSYVGNGSANGPFVYTGFEPAWLLVKETSSSGGYWYVVDNKRNTSNPRTLNLFPNDSGAEASYASFNFFSNGFQPSNTWGDTNASGDTYLFWAIAANPDTTAPTKANSFKTKIYTGNNSTQSITGAGFKPDFIWFKNRTGTNAHALVDSVRGRASTWFSNLTNAATSSGASNDLVSFDSDGFTVGSVSNAGSTNTNGGSIVAWLWKALDHDRNLAAINNDGSIPSIVSANPEAGFSIVKFTAPGVFNQFAVGHGLSSAPQIIIQKAITSGTANNYVLTNAIDGSGDYLKLDTADAKTDISGSATSLFRFDPKTFTDWWSSAQTVINYCWHSVAGYSKIGTYTGSGASGKTVTTGFEPSWVMIKNTTTAGLSWAIFDNKRSTANPRNLVLWPDVNNTEYTQTDGLNFNSTGFEVINATNWLNKSGDTLIYMAFK